MAALPLWKKAAFGAAVPLGLLVVVELGLRLAGYPRGNFEVLVSSRLGLWRPHVDFDAKFGPRSYRVRANALGFRGPELRSGKDAAATRIVAIGDSVTDGFFVDNEGTYPAQLERLLLRSGYDVEVVNAARGAASIERAYGVLRTIVVPLEPAIVLHVFVTNDLVELARYTPEQLRDPDVKARSPRLGRFSQLFITQTALGEVIFDSVLRAASPHYRQSEREPEANPFEGADRYEEHAREFLLSLRDQELALFREELGSETERLLAVYLDLFDRFIAECRSNRIELLFAYFPGYSEVYLSDQPTTFRDRLRREVEARGVPFVDLTEPWRRGTQEYGPLNFTPADYHPNEAGYKVIAEALAERMEALGWLEPARTP